MLQRESAAGRGSLIECLRDEVGMARVARVAVEDPIDVGHGHRSLRVSVRHSLVKGRLF